MNRPSLPPAAVRVLGALVAIHAVRTALPDGYDFALVRVLAFAPFRGGALDPALLYGAVTSVFVHADWTHLLVNGLCAAVLSAQLHPHLGGGRYLAFFAVTGGFGALAHAVVNWGHETLLLGSSGAVFGLFGAGAHVLLRGGDGRSRPRPRDYLQYVLVMMIVNLGYASLGGGRVSWEAHAGGFFAGLALFPLLRGRPLPARIR